MGAQTDVVLLMALLWVAWCAVVVIAAVVFVFAMRRADRERRRRGGARVVDLSEYRSRRWRGDHGRGLRPGYRPVDPERARLMRVGPPCHR